MVPNVRKVHILYAINRRRGYFTRKYDGITNIKILGFRLSTIEKMKSSEHLLENRLTKNDLIFFILQTKNRTKTLNDEKISNSHTRDLAIIFLLSGGDKISSGVKKGGNLGENFHFT